MAAALETATSVCISAHLVRDKANSHEMFDVETGEDKLVPGRPGYYSLLPLTVAADLATSPFQLAFFIYTSKDRFDQATIYNVLIPLP